jgi:hypothetical protein
MAGDAINMMANTRARMRNHFMTVDFSMAKSVADDG